MVLAGALHDDVLQPLYKVHLMAQVLRQDLASGRLFDLDQDLPDLLKATDTASSSIRTLIRGLRNASTQSSDLRATLRLLVDELRGESPIVVEESLEDIVGPPEIKLVAYQIAREATSNAIKHSGAGTVSLKVLNDRGEIRVEVRDDGRGFDLSQVDRTQHFGLLLMKERVEPVGGLLHVSTGPQGTTIVARLPSDAG